MTNKSYEVKSGDTLWKICQKEFNLKSNTDIANKVAEISKTNNISSNSIFVGQKLDLGVGEQPKNEPVSSEVVEEPKLASTSLLTKMTTKWALDEFNWWESDMFNAEQPFVNNGFAGGPLEPTTYKAISNAVEKFENNNHTNQTYTTNNLLNDMKNSGKFTTDQIRLIENRIKKGTYNKEDLELIKNTKIYSKSEIKEIIKEEAQKYGIPVPLIEAIVNRESTWIQFNKNKSSGAGGLMQLTKRTAKWLGCNNVYDAKENIKAGVKYFAYLMKQFAKYDGHKGTLIEHALCAYNWGETNYRRYLNGDPNITMPEETVKYKMLASSSSGVNNTNIA